MYDNNEYQDPPPHILSPSLATGTLPLVPERMHALAACNLYISP